MLLEFIILGFAFSIAFSFIALANIRKGKIAKNLFYIFIVLIIGFSISGIFIVEKMNDDKLWNKGYCNECGEEWELFNVVHYRNSGNEYWYKCPKCKNTITIHSKLNKGE